MNKWQRINLAVFFGMVAITACLPYVLKGNFFSAPLGKPWHLQPSIPEDSLGVTYKDHYKIANKKPLRTMLQDSLQPQVHILVDAWGVPVNESVLEGDLSFFADIPHQFLLHRRLANRTKHAEKVELRNHIESNLYLFGGDSLEYGRADYISELGFRQMLFCQSCNDSLMVTKIDSLLSTDSLTFIAWTTQSARTGEQDSLRNSLRQIAGLAKRHPQVAFVVQGTHRPILGSPETRNAHKAHWVPGVILNLK